MINLKMLAVWLSRINHCRGFGVQSPSAYAFIRYVISEHYAYYAYIDMLKAWPCLKGLRLKLCRLYFRLANYAQAEQWGWCGTLPEAERQHIMCGCHHTLIHTSSTGQPVVPQPTNVKTAVGVAALSATEHERQAFVEQFVSTWDKNLSPDNDNIRTLLVVEGIGYDAAAKALWQKLLNDNRTGITFDLYYCGIVFFDKRYKQNYIVNF